MNQAIIRAFVIVGGVIGALLLSTILAEANFFFLLLTAVGMAGLAFVAVFWRFTILIAWAFICFAFSWYPAGINLSWEELAYLTPLALCILTVWRLPDKPPPLPASLEISKQRLLRITLIWGIFMVACFAWRILEVRSYGEPGMKNVVKSYVSLIVPALLTVYYATRPSLLSLPKRPERFLLLILSAGCALNICTRIYQSYFGGSEFDVATNSFLAGPFVIYGVNVVESIYALRVVAPLLVLFAVLFMTRQSLHLRDRILPAAALFLGMFGALMSGGRATLVICCALIAGVFIIRKWWTPILLGLIAAVSLVLLVNAFSREIEDIGGNIVSRSVSWLIFTEGTSATGDIEASTRWRRLVFGDAIDVWLENPRNFLVGRGYQGFSESDYNDVRQQEYYEAIRIAVQRGASHALLSDGLLISGLIGVLIYYTTIILGMVMGWRAAHTTTLSAFTQDCGWALCFVLGQRLTVGTVSGGLNSLTLDFVLIVTLLVSANRDEHLGTEAPRLEAEGEEESTYAGVAL